jgi:hypothetical protein
MVKMPEIIKENASKKMQRCNQTTKQKTHGCEKCSEN